MNSNSDWAPILSALEAGHAQKALVALRQLLDDARADAHAGDYIGALIRIATLESSLQGDRSVGKLAIVEGALLTAPASAVSLLKAILASWHHKQVHDYSWRLNQMGVAEATLENIDEWSSSQFLRRADTLFQQALQDDETLGRSPVTDYAACLKDHLAPSDFWPTVLDLVAGMAVEFYGSDEFWLLAFEGIDELPASSPILGDLAEFLAWEVPENLADPIRKGVTVFRRILRFHEADADPAALVDADLRRLRFGRRYVEPYDRTARLVSAFERVAERHSSHPVASLALYYAAQELRGDNQLAAAHAIALKGCTLHLEGVGSAWCAEVASNLEVPWLHMRTERGWHAQNRLIEIRSRNLDEIHFRLVPMHWEAFIRRHHKLPDNLNQPDVEALIAETPAAEWSAALTRDPGYRETTKLIEGPADVPPGFYILLASCRPDFGSTDNDVSFECVWVTNLAVHIRPVTEAIDGVVMDALSGAPIAGAEIRFWELDQRNTKRLGTTTSDTDGCFRFSHSKGCLVHVTVGDQQISSGTVYGHSERSDRREYRTLMVTDRPIYRPGQTIQYKGICVQVDRGRDDYGVMRERNLRVELTGGNYQVIASRKHITSEWGSFSGSFVAPDAALAGWMTIQVRQGSVPGHVRFRVEEYKRPRFTLEVDASPAPVALDRLITVSGSIRAYVGSAVQGLPVKYKVTRDGGRSAATTIAVGTVSTAADGRFAFEFTSTRPRRVLEKSHPLEFVVLVEATDPTGETVSKKISIATEPSDFARVVTQTDPWWSEGTWNRIRVACTSPDGRPFRGCGRLVALATTQLPSGTHFELGAKVELVSRPEFSASVWETEFTTDRDGRAEVDCELPAGQFGIRAVIDDAGETRQSVETIVTVLRRNDASFPCGAPFFAAVSATTVETGKTLSLAWGSRFSDGRALIEFVRRGQVVRRLWTMPGRNQEVIDFPIDDSMRGGIQVSVLQVHDGAVGYYSQIVGVPWVDKILHLRWERFTSRLTPGAEETWSLVVTRRDGTPISVEAVATLYDASLCALSAFEWFRSFDFFYFLRSEPTYGRRDPYFSNAIAWLRSRLGGFTTRTSVRNLPYPEVEDVAKLAWIGARVVTAHGGAASAGLRMRSYAAAPVEGAASGAWDGIEEERTTDFFRVTDAAPEIDDKPAFPTPDLLAVVPRQNLNETAFFLPCEHSDDFGRITFRFRMPESMTTWKLLCFVHDKELRYGFIEATSMSWRKIVVLPNAPRFFREGDVVEMTAKVINQSEEKQFGTVVLYLDTATESESRRWDAGSAFDLVAAEQSFAVEPGASAKFSWRLRAPAGIAQVAYKVIAATADCSDGEENVVPILPRRVLVSDSLPLAIPGPGEHRFQLASLANTGAQVESIRFTVQVVSNPIWYALTSLPYLMRFPHECSEQLFNRLYSHLLAHQLLTSRPEIKQQFTKWRGSQSDVSGLARGAHLRDASLEESPWFRQGESEAAARRRFAILFDEQALATQQRRTMEKLKKLQQPDGSFPWFAGGSTSPRITLYIAAGIGRLRRLGIECSLSAELIVAWMDRWIIKWNAEARRTKDGYTLDPTAAYWWYARSFFLDEMPIPELSREAFDVLKSEARRDWGTFYSWFLQVCIALGAHRSGEIDLARAIMESVRERAINDPERGMYWTSLESPGWFDAPIETQALIIEAFHEITGDQEAVDQCRKWLLFRKQTHAWPTTKATADAVYALIRFGTDWMSDRQALTVSMGAVSRIQDLENDGPLFETHLTGDEITPESSNVVVHKVDTGIAWGGLHWEYLTDIASTTAHGNRLRVEKEIYRRDLEGTLQACTGVLHPGDELIIRLKLHSDRDLEFVHVQDQRGSGLEPAETLSGYRFAGGAFFYQSHRDTASHFFFDRLRKGNTVIEYACRVVHCGHFEAGYAEIESMYAPEFSARSERRSLRVAPTETQ